MKILFKVMSPISHSSFGDRNLGNFTSFRTMNIVNLDGFPTIPIISGNSIRGKLRRMAMNELYNSFGVKFDEKFIEHFKSEAVAKKAWDRMYAALFVGGTIDSVDVRINPDELRNLRKQLPPLSAFGSALYSIMLSGVTDIGFAVPYCEETVKAGLWELEKPSEIMPKAQDLVGIIGLTRHPDRENADPNLTGVKPMPYEMECIIPGAWMSINIDFLPMATEIERGCIFHVTKQLKKICGKNSVGFGNIAISNIDFEADTEESENLYTQWLENSCEADVYQILIDFANRVV